MQPKPLKIAEIILLIVVVGVGGWWLMKSEMPQSYAETEHQMLSEVKSSSKNPLLSVDLKAVGNMVEITMDFSEKDLYDGFEMFEGTLYLESAIIEKFIPPQFTEVKYIVLIEGKPLDQLVREAEQRGILIRSTDDREAINRILSKSWNPHNI